jgi:hypothetical protein
MTFFIEYDEVKALFGCEVAGVWSPCQSKLWQKKFFHQQGLATLQFFLFAETKDL